jgi:ribosome-associated protein
MIKIGEDVVVSDDELVFKTSRSSGPGGQNVNKVSTRVTLLFDVASCKSFSQEQKQRILKRLASKADKTGTIRVVSQKFRTQSANRRAAVERLRQLLLAGLKRAPVRIKTEKPSSAKQRRLEKKRQRSLLKQQRARQSSIKDSMY